MQVPYQHRYIIHALVIDDEDHWPANRQVLFVYESDGIAHCVIGAFKAKVEYINRPFMRTVTENIKADPLYGMKNDQYQTEQQVMDRR